MRSDLPRPDTTEVARDQTLYWTLSFYISIDTLRRAANAGEDSRSIPEIITALAVDHRTRALRDAIEPLFNDIADRSRLGKIEDFLFAGGKPKQLIFSMPQKVRWTTEGKRYEVPLEPEQREREMGLRRFWYLHANGSMSWHLAFSAYYGDDLERDAAMGIPATYYFLSLLQKLAWPKEFAVKKQGAAIDDLVGIRVRRSRSARGVPFWDFIADRFEKDMPLIRAMYPNMPSGTGFTNLVESKSSIEVPGLNCVNNRSLFFIRDSRFFALIQPKDKKGAIESRRLRVTDTDFSRYPDLIAKQQARRGVVELGPGYWTEMRAQPSKISAVKAEEHLAYLFLAGFNQNIIDFTNQEASEVLDSLDPIYPNSEEQKEEGFFIRYANPRAMITYVSRSRTLEVGNDHIGTCPYAFLIHVLSMHNEALTRAQEESTFNAIDKITCHIREGRALKTGNHKHYERAEALINETRIAAFEVYDRHRYVNPFRYDTERDVFDELERLRGTSRLKLAYEAALASLDEQTRDLERLRQAEDAERTEAHDRTLSVLLGVFGIFGVIQVFFQVDEFFRGEGAVWQKILTVVLYCGIPLVLGVYLIRRFGRIRRQGE